MKLGIEFYVRKLVIKFPGASQKPFKFIIIETLLEIKIKKLLHNIIIAYNKC